MTAETARAIILAAGRGMRLRPHTDGGPKVCLPFGGKTLLERQRSALRKAGVTDHHLVCGYKKEVFSNSDLTLWPNDDWESSNMLWSFLQAKDVVLSGGTTLICYGDIVYEPRIVRDLLQAKGDVAVVVDTAWQSLWGVRNSNILDDAETLKMDADGRLLDIGRKPRSLEEIDAQYIGLIKLTPKGAIAFFEHVAEFSKSATHESLKAAYMTDFLLSLIQSGTLVTGVPISRGWLEFDTVGDLNVYTTMLQHGTLTTYYNELAC